MRSILVISSDEAAHLQPRQTDLDAIIVAVEAGVDWRHLREFAETRPSARD